MHRRNLILLIFEVIVLNCTITDCFSIAKMFAIVTKQEMYICIYVLKLKRLLFPLLPPFSSLGHTAPICTAYIVCSALFIGTFDVNIGQNGVRLREISKGAII